MIGPGHFLETFGPIFSTSWREVRSENIFQQPLQTHFLEKSMIKPGNLKFFTFWQKLIFGKIEFVHRILCNIYYLVYYIQNKENRKNITIMFCISFYINFLGKFDESSKLLIFAFKLKCTCYIKNCYSWNDWSKKFLLP